MSVFKHSLHIASDTRGERLDLARELIDSERESVVLENCIAIRKTGNRVECAVITRFPSTGNPSVFESEAEDAKHLLEGSSIRPLVGGPIDWIVIDDYGMGAVQVWPTR